jgi:hypothetical protein
VTASGSTAARRTLGDVLRDLERDHAQHITSGPAGEDELQRLEAAVGHPLPESYCALLALLGGGLYYDRHEIFGPHLVLIHDIELVPSLLAMRQRLEKERGHALAGLLPLHRSGTRIHLIDVRASSGRVVTMDGPETYPDLAAFLDAVVMPGRERV